MPFRDEPMTDRQRFQAIMNYQPADRGFIQDFQAWDETADVWHAYGLPADVTSHRGWAEFFGFDRFWDTLSCQPLLHPDLPTKVLADEGDTQVIQNSDGAIVRRHKYASSIPAHLDHLLKDRRSWEEHFKPRLVPTRDRLWPDMQARLAAVRDRDYPLAIWAGSTFGKLRDWMGLEGVSYVQYDDPSLFSEMIGTMGDCIVGTLELVLAEADRAGVRYDLAQMWEDMSFASGPLMSVEHFDRYLVPQYERITATLRAHGVDLVMLDSDGDVSLLLPRWLKAGVNVAFPLEVGTWGLDAVAVRRTFGPELRLCGAFDKHILARTPDDISREIDRLAPLVEEGGFIPFCDHRVPPDVSFTNYLHYVERARQVWGRGRANLRPMGRPNQAAPRFGQPYEYRSFLDARPAQH